MGGATDKGFERMEGGRNDFFDSGAPMASPADTPKKKHVMIFEPLTGGHRSEFISHLLDYVGASKREERIYTFVLASIPPSSLTLSNVRFVEISKKEKVMINKVDAKGGSFSFWSVLNRYLNRFKPDHLIIMDLTWLELALCFKRLPCKTSAILFVQYPELRSISAPTLRDRLKFILKEFKTGLLLRNQMLKKIVLLNGDFSSNYLNERFGTNRFVPIPDPVPEIMADPSVQLRKEYGIEAGRRIFLFFGSMSARKGVDNLVDSMGLLSPEATQNSAFIFCGQPEADYVKRYHELVTLLIQKRPDICLYFEERFISSARMRALFEQSDWILMPYTRPEYSSGILVHAAAAKTPVIGSEDGLVGRKIREHGLGLGISLDTLPRVLEEAVSGVHRFNETARQAFVEASSPEKFASILLEVCS